MNPIPQILTGGGGGSSCLLDYDALRTKIDMWLTPKVECWIHKLVPLSGHKNFLLIGSPSYNNIDNIKNRKYNSVLQ